VTLTDNSFKASQHLFNTIQQL